VEGWRAFESYAWSPIVVANLLTLAGAKLAT